MSNKFNTLSSTILQSNTTYHRPPQVLPDIVKAESPAVDVMTDFCKVAAITMGPCATIDDAQQRMIASGVRLLFVTNQSNAIIGVITLTDINGEKPVKYMQKTGCKREEIFLRDIMTPQDQLEVLQMVDVEKATVGDIIETMKQAARQHALVVDYDGDHQVIRGLFSTKQISKQLGITFKPSELNHTFAELESMLG